MTANRRDFLRQAGAGLGLAAGAMAAAPGVRAAEAKPAAAKAPNNPAANPADVPVSMDQTTDLKTPQLPAENELSRRCLRMLQQWIPVGAAADGRIYAANCGTQPASVQIARGENSGKRQPLAPGEVRLL